MTLKTLIKTKRNKDKNKIKNCYQRKKFKNT